MLVRIQMLKMTRIRFIMAVLLLSGLRMVQAAVPDCAAAETNGTVAVSAVQQLEKAVVSSETKKILYCAGKVTNKKSLVWKKAKKFTLQSKQLRITKKGWYTFRITKTSGKYKMFSLKLKKKTYSIEPNTPVRQKAGCFYLVPQSSTNQSLAIRDSALSSGAAISLQTKGSTAGSVWQLESAGGTKFRLRNLNSGLYLTAAKSKAKGTVLTQKKYSVENKGQMFWSYLAAKNYYYIRNALTKEYLNLTGDSLTAGSRNNKKTWKFRFVSLVTPSSSIKVTGETAPVSLVYGSAFIIKGMVTSVYSICSLTARITEADGTVCLQKTVEPMACQYDLAGVDAALTFGKLAVGSYRYQVMATDTAGVTQTILDRDFVVYVPAGTITKTLVYNPESIVSVGHQSTGDALEKKACASYALAYCQAILTGTVVSPHTYWSSGTNVDCVWSKGGYTTAAYGSESQVLQAAYGQLSAGKPCILHVTGATGNQHWVTLVGYKNVTTVSGLTAANFIALDPWYGTVITVSDSYQVRTTYRLAYQSIS